MKCPTCRCENFYVKDDDDEYEIYEFSTLGKNIVFDKEIDPQKIPKITNEIATFCNKCAWHGKFDTLTK